VTVWAAWLIAATLPWEGPVTIASVLGSPSGSPPHEREIVVAVSLRTVIGAELQLGARSRATLTWLVVPLVSSHVT